MTHTITATLSKQIRQKLDALGPSSGASVQAIEAREGDLAVRCELSAWDSLACAVSTLCLETSRLANATDRDLERIAKTLSERLTYLLEPISPVEFDREHSVVQLRSKPPSKTDDGTGYYELLVRRGGDISLCRYQARPGELRTQTAAHLTREAMLRVIDDFEAVVAK